MSESNDSDVPAAPSLDLAWEFYNSNQPRRIKVAKLEGSSTSVAFSLSSSQRGAGAQQSNKGTGYRLANVGESHDPVSGSPAELYSLFGSFSELDEFGIGVSLYFRQLLLLGFVIACCAAVNYKTLSENKGFNPDGTDLTLQGSVLGADRSDLSFKNQGTADIITCAILAVFVFLLHRIEEKNIEAIDLSQQTPQDYSVKISMLPHHVSDPDMYHRFFSKWGDVVFVTIAKNNGKLLKAIADVRTLDLTIHSHEVAEKRAVKAGQKVVRQSDLTPGQVTRQKLFGTNQTSESLQERRAKLVSEVEKLTKPVYRPKYAYVIFNTEGAQRQCLRDCASGYLEKKLNVQCCAGSNRNARFEEHVLRVEEPVEPSEVIWENLHAHYASRLWGLVKSYTITIGIILGCFFTLRSLTVQAGTGNSQASVAATVFISVLNGALPMVLKTITQQLEVHVDEGDVQNSMLLKLMVARCLNTGVLMYAVTTFDQQFSGAHLGQIMSILIADCGTTPVMRILNIYEHVQHRVVAPTKNTQAEMNALFQGGYWNLAERYTDMIKTLFVGLFYSTVVPSSLFVTAAAFFITYWVDKYCLLRMWARPPAYDEAMARTTRKMIMVCVWVHIIMARVFFANWPYENKELDEADCDLFVCYEPPGKWTDDQKQVVNIYQGVGITIFVVVILVLIVKGIYRGMKALLCQKIDEVGEASGVEFRNLNGVSAYVPSLRRAALLEPLFACPLNTVPSNYIPCRQYDSEMRPTNIGSLSICSPRDLPFIKDVGELSSLFGCCKFYPKPEGGSVQLPINANEGIVSQLYKNAVTAASSVPMVRAAAPVNTQGLLDQFNRFTPNVFKPVHNPPPMAGPVLHIPTVGSPYAVPQPMQVQGSPYAPQQVGMRGGPFPFVQQYPQQQMPYGGQRPLPPGWQACAAPDGRQYFVNHITQTTQWEFPQ